MNVESYARRVAEATIGPLHDERGRLGPCECYGHRAYRAALDELQRLAREKDEERERAVREEREWVDREIFAPYCGDYVPNALYQELRKWLLGGRARGGSDG